MVIKTTPFAALEPYREVAAASFNIEKDSISSGLILFNPVDIGSPSTTNNGSLPPFIEAAWMEGKLMFKNMPLPQVLKRLSYFYNVKFEIQDPVINSYYFNGTFENKQLSQVLDYLKISSRIDYEIKQAMTDDSQGSQSTMVILRKKKGNE